MSPELRQIANRLWREYEMGDRVTQRPPWAEMSAEQKLSIVDLTITTNDHLYALWNVEIIRERRKLGEPVGVSAESLQEQAMAQVFANIVEAVDAVERSLANGHDEA